MESDALTLVSGLYNKESFENLRTCIDSAENYYQNSFHFNLERNASDRTHSIDWLLSNPKKQHFQNKFTPESEDLCQSCLLSPKICMALMGICAKIELHPNANKAKVDNWRFLIDKCERAILEYRNFIVRNKMSNMDWESYLSTEDPETAVVVFDYAMNFLPQKHR